MITNKKEVLFLERLFEKYNISEKDRYEIREIYHFLPLEKQGNLLLHFQSIVEKMEAIQKDLQIEQGILIGQALTEIEKAIQQVKQKN